MYLGQQVDKIIPGNVGIGGANMGQVPLFSVQWCPSRAAIWAGYVAADGQELDTSLYPDAFAGIQAGNVPTVAAATWISTPAERGKYVQSSSAGKMRVPDYNGRAAGSLGALFLRGDGALSAAVAGAIQADEFKSHFHTTNNVDNTGTDVTKWVYGDPGTGAPEVSSVQTNATGGTETRPLNVTGCWVIKLFGQVTNPGRADAAQLATAYAGMVTRIGTIEDAFLEHSLTDNGYQKLPGGLIIQWGRTTDTASAIFPITFPTAALAIYASSDQLPTSSTATTTARILSTSTFSASWGTVTGDFVYWLAIGF